MIMKRLKKSYEPMIPATHIYFTFAPQQFQLPKCCRLSYRFQPSQDRVLSHRSCYSLQGYNSHLIFYNVVYRFIRSPCREQASLLSYLQLSTCSKYPQKSFHMLLKLLIIESLISNLRDYNHTISNL